METGAPTYVATFNHSAAASKAAIMSQMKVSASPIRAGSIIPFFIVLTTSAEPADRARVLAEGASGYFIKPSSVSALTEMMRSVVQQWIPEALMT